MDAFTPSLLKKGLAGAIGKGSRTEEVRKAIKKYKAVYFLAYAGCGALLATHVKKMKLLAYPDLGPEAIYRLEVENFPLIVGIDSQGRDIYRSHKNAKTQRHT
jgi:fumarate hydratase subunit beta